MLGWLPTKSVSFLCSIGWLSCVYSTFLCSFLQVKVHWERSGTGSDQPKNTVIDDSNDPNDGYDSDGSKSLVDGSDKQEFLGEYPSHILYYWELSVKEDMLIPSIGQVDSAATSDGNKAPPTLSERKENKRKRNTVHEEAILESKQEMKMMVVTNIDRELRHNNETLFELNLKLFDNCLPDAAVPFIKKRIEEVKKIISCYEQQRKKRYAEILSLDAGTSGP